MLKSIKMCFALVLIHICSPGFSQGLPNVVVHGFVSQGYLKSTENSFLANSKDGSFEFNETAINFMTQINSKLRIGLQLFSRDMGRESNNSVILDWAYGDYHWQDYLGIRFGKIKMPLGYYNLVRDVDLYRNSILLPQGVYDETQRDFSLAMQGGSLYGYVPLVKNSTIEYEVCIGTLTIPDAYTTYWNWSLDFFTKELSKLANSSCLLGERNVVGKTIWGAALNWETPVKGFKMGASNIQGELLLKSDLNLIIPATNSSRVLPGDVSISAKIDKYDVFSTEYSIGNFVFTAEYLELIFKTNTSVMLPDLFPNPITIPITFNATGYYGQITFKASDKWTLNTYYSEFYPDKNDKEGNQLESDRLKYTAWQKDLCFTLRLDPISNWVFKLEGHYIDGAAQAYRFDQPAKRYWNLFALKTSYNF